MDSNNNTTQDITIIITKCVYLITIISIFTIIIKCMYMYFSPILFLLYMNNLTINIQGRDSSVSWWHKYFNQVWKWWHAKSGNKQNYVRIVMWFTQLVFWYTLRDTEQSDFIHLAWFNSMVIKYKHDIKVWVYILPNI